MRRSFAIENTRPAFVPSLGAPEIILTFMTQGSLKDQVVERLGWLAPEETDTVMGNGTDYVIWEKGISILLEKADMICANEGGEEENKKRLASAPLGLKNRWRIWEILQGMRLSTRYHSSSICAVIPSGMPPSSSHVWTSEHVWTVRYSIDNELCEFETGILGTLRTPFGPRASPICWYSVLLPNSHPTRLFAMFSSYGF